MEPWARLSPEEAREAVHIRDVCLGQVGRRPLGGSGGGLGSRSVRGVGDVGEGGGGIGSGDGIGHMAHGCGAAGPAARVRPARVGYITLHVCSIGAPRLVLGRKGVLDIHRGHEGTLAESCEHCGKRREALGAVLDESGVDGGDVHGDAGLVSLACARVQHAGRHWREVMGRLRDEAVERQGRLEGVVHPGGARGHARVLQGAAALL
mmetsp:Transcript_26137/g.70675  ORF Transcript_26137/g.70675 Transcript_26137/m.70675 type:complete len:207 (+) Transcript_26137:351-971(+)